MESSRLYKLIQHINTTPSLPPKIQAAQPPCHYKWYLHFSASRITSRTQKLSYLLFQEEIWRSEPRVIKLVSTEMYHLHFHWPCCTCPKDECKTCIFQLTPKIFVKIWNRKSCSKSLLRCYTDWIVPNQEVTVQKNNMK